MLWNRKTGKPVANALVWQDTRVDDYVAELSREGGADRFRAKTGLPLSTYFSSLKIRWLLEHVPGVRKQAEAGEVIFGNIDSFLTWHLTGGADGGLHITDVTNASRTQLMDLDTLSWDEDLLDAFGIPAGDVAAHLLQRRSLRDGESRRCAGSRDRRNSGRPAGRAGGPDLLQIRRSQEHLRHRMFPADEYRGTRCALHLRTAHHRRLQVRQSSRHDYALEGSIAITGALVQWMRDNLGLIGRSPEIETLARTVEDNGGVYFVPAFSGLYAPYWKHNARGVIAGLTRYVNKGHLARAVLEATAFQTREVVEAMEQDSGIALDVLRVDGGMVDNALLMQFQADILNRPVVKPLIKETTALGAAYAAGLAVGFYKNTDDLRARWSVGQTWNPSLDEPKRAEMYRLWKKAVTRRSIGLSRFEA